MNAFLGVVLVRVIIALAGWSCLYFGFRLFSIWTEKQGQITLQLGSERKLSLKDLVPGIYFAVLEAGILLGSLAYPMQFASEQEGERRRTFVVGDPLQAPSPVIAMPSPSTPDVGMPRFDPMSASPPAPPAPRDDSPTRVYPAVPRGSTGELVPPGPSSRP